MTQLTRQHALWFMVVCLLVAGALRLPNVLDAPPGVHYDEAANAILAANIGLRGERPIFISSYTGKETFFFYAAGGVNALLGPGQELLALRVTAVFIGLLTISATYWLGRELMRDRRLALFTAVLLATSFWHVLFSRLGFRAISQPLWQAIMLAALFHGLRRRQTSRTAWAWFALSGVALGVTAYTYLAARLFPVLLLLSCWPLLLDRPTWRRIWRPLLLLVGMGLLVLSPLLGYFAQNPEAFWVRITQVGTGSETLTLADSMARSLAMFGFAGDPYWRFNIPERPLLPLLWFVLGVGGWGVAAWRGWRARQSHGRVAYLLLLFNPLIMLLPTALATNEIVPSNLRAIGLLPLLLFLPALGGVAVLDQLVPKMPRAGWLIGLTAVLFVSGLVTAQVYFVQWATRVDLFYENDGDLAAVSAYLNEHVDELPPPLFMGSRFYQPPTVALLAEPYEDVRWVVESRALVVPPEGTATFLIPASSPLPIGLQRTLDTAVPITETGPPGPDGTPLFTRFTLTTTPVITPGRLLEANFGYGVTLLGADVGSGAGGETLPLTLYWQVTGEPPETWVPFVQLEDSAGYRWSQSEPNPYPSEQWQVGETILQEVAVSLPEGMPPGRYRLRVGLFAPDGEKIAPVARFDVNGRYAGSGLTLEDVFVLPRDGVSESLPVPEVAVDTAVWPSAQNRLQLRGYQPAAWRIHGGEPLNLELQWLAAEDTPLPQLTSRFELMRADNTGKILLDSQPAYGTFPFAQWPTPQFVRDRQSVPTPADLEAGAYRLQLRLLDAGDQTLLVQSLGTVTVEASDRRFAVPDLPNFVEMDAVFGEELLLAGYTLDEAADTLTLVWQATDEPATDYTTFVHLLRADGSCCLWQSDTPPSLRGTSLWLPGEVVTTTYNIDIPDGTPPGAYAVEIGLYVPENGQRLVVEATAEHGADFVLLRPWVIRE